MASVTALVGAVHTRAAVAYAPNTFSSLWTRLVRLVVLGRVRKILRFFFAQIQVTGHSVRKHAIIMRCLSASNVCARLVMAARPVRAARCVGGAAPAAAAVSTGFFSGIRLSQRPRSMGTARRSKLAATNVAATGMETKVSCRQPADRERFRARLLLI